MPMDFCARLVAMLRGQDRLVSLVSMKYGSSGRVSMDLITLDVTDVPNDLARRGDWVEVINDRVTVDDLTDRAGTIGYELLSRLSRRVHRHYIEQRD